MSTARVAPAASSSAITFTSPIRRFLRLQAVPVTAALLIVFAVGSLVAPGSLQRGSIIAMIVPAAVIAVAACGQTLVVQQKGIDLSSGAVITLGAIVMGYSSSAGIPLLACLVIVLIAGLLAGLLNGILVTVLHITPIIATLASAALFSGVVWTVSKGVLAQPPLELREFGTAIYLGLPAIAWVAVLIVAVTAFIMWRSVAGRRFVGVGANSAAARAAGFEPAPSILTAYVGSSVLSALAGVLISSYVGSASFDMGNQYTLPVIASVFIGGAALSGGRGSVVASAVAALFLSYVVQLLLTMGVPESAKLLVQAAALALASMLFAFSRSRRGKRQSRLATATA